MSDNKLKALNIIALGNSNVGKTSFIVRYTENYFRDFYLSTVGIDYKTKIITLPNKNKYKVDFYDTAGQERYKSIAVNVIKNADGIILMYDITQQNTFESISNWMENIFSQKGKDFPVVLIGNKCDLEERVVSKDEGEEMAKKYGLSFFESSNKTGENIEEAGMELINKIIEKKEKDKAFENEDDNQVKLRIKKNNKKKKCCK